MTPENLHCTAYVHTKPDKQFEEEFLGENDFFANTEDQLPVRTYTGTRTRLGTE